MNLTRKGKIARHLVRHPAYRAAFAQLDAALEENTRPDPDEIGRILRGEPAKRNRSGDSTPDGSRLSD